MAQMALEEDELYYTDLSVGEILRRTRMHYGQSVYDIERALRIKASQIQAIESDSIEKLPGRVYALGFVRSYSEYLGLDGDKMVGLFKKQAGRHATQPELHFPVAASESKVPSVAVILLSLTLLLIVAAIAWQYQNSSKQEATIPPVPEHLQKGGISGSEDVAKVVKPEGFIGPQLPGEAVGKQEDSTDSLSVSTPVPNMTEGVTVHQETEEPSIILTINESSWVEIKDQNGEPVVSRVLKAGDQYFVPNRPDLTMSLGNAGGVGLEINGQTVTALGKSGEIIRDIALDTQTLTSRFFSSAQGTEN